MSFTKKTWRDRVTEFPTRRTITKTDGSSELVTVSRAEGEVSQEGDAFSAENMNDLEGRIAFAFGGCSFDIQEDGAYVTYTPPGGADSVTKKLGSGDIGNILNFKKYWVPNGTPQKVTFEAEKGKKYYIVVTCTYAVGDYDYAYYTYSKSEVIQGVGTLTVIKEEDATTQSGVSSSYGTQTNLTKIRTSIYILDAAEAGTVTISSGAVNTTGIYNQTAHMEVNVCGN